MTDMYGMLPVNQSLESPLHIPGLGRQETEEVRAGRVCECRCRYRYKGQGCGAVRLTSLDMTMV